MLEMVAIVLTAAGRTVRFEGRNGLLTASLAVGDTHWSGLATWDDFAQTWRMPHSGRPVAPTVQSDLVGAFMDISCMNRGGLYVEAV